MSSRTLAHAVCGLACSVGSGWHRRRLPGRRKLQLWLSATSVLAGLTGAAPAAAQDVLALASTEPKFFEAGSEPVLSVTRLAQPVADVPGALTVLDRHLLRRSGARNLTEALRLVPGYMVGGFNGANLAAAYQAPVDEYGVRSLVLVDGRSLYSPAYAGGSFRALNAIPIDEVERIEVLRGSNSAAFGAHALFGVINVVTRHALDTLGQALVLNHGSAGVADVYARIGWGVPEMAQRLSITQMADDGWRDLHDGLRQTTLLWRADWQPNAQSEWMLQVGLGERRAGHGFAANVHNPRRNVRLDASHVLVSYSQRPSLDSAWKASFSWDEARMHDAHTLTSGAFAGVRVDLGYHERRLAFDFERSQVLSSGLRTVWGLGLREDSAQSPALYHGMGRVAVNDVRLFAHGEWAFAPQWLLNVGALVSQRSDTGSFVAPRLMLNHTLAPGHTLRAGVTQAQRPPLLFERSADERFFFADGRLAALAGRPNLALRNEVLSVQELGYHGLLAGGAVELDVRLHHQRLRDFIQFRTLGPTERQFRNAPGFTVQGLEYQLVWRPNTRHELRWQQSFNDFEWHEAGESGRNPPARQSTLAWFATFDAGWSLGLMLHERSAMAWRPNAARSTIDATTRVDARLARAFEWNGARTELAVSVQSLTGDLDEFVPNRLSNQRVYASLRLEF